MNLIALRHAALHLARKGMDADEISRAIDVHIVTAAQAVRIAINETRAAAPSRLGVEQAADEAGRPACSTVRGP